MFFNTTKYIHTCILFGILLISFNTNALHLEELTIKQVHALPDTIRQMITSNQIPRNSILLQLVNNKPHTYRLSTFVREDRYAVFCDFLDEVQQDTQLPDGSYVLSFRDHLPIAPLCPILVYAANKNLVAQGKEVLMPDVCAMQGYAQTFSAVDEAIEANPWNKKLPVIFWRGATTGNDFTYENINNLDRVNLIKKSRSLPFLDAEFTSHGKVLRAKSMPQSFFSDFPLHPKVDYKGSLTYKYLISIDGNTCTYSRVAWILYSNSLMLKHDSDDIQWYYHQLKPYVHYIPVNKDFSNLETQYQWAQSHQLEVAQIIKNAHEFAKQVFNDKAIREAFVAALHEYNSTIAS